MANLLQRITSIFAGTAPRRPDPVPPIQVPVLMPSAATSSLEVRRREEAREPSVGSEPAVPKEPSVAREPAVPIS